MPQNWDYDGRRVILSETERVSVPYLLSDEQAERWAAAGFDLVAAAIRVRRFDAGFKSLPTARDAALALRDFYRGERRLAVASGVSPDDPHLGRIEASAGCYVWTRAGAV